MLGLHTLDRGPSKNFVTIFVLDFNRATIGENQLRLLDELTR
jgi:hypothetical protein